MNSDSDHHARRRTELGDWLEFLVAESHVLRDYPELLWQQAANQPEGSAPARQADLTLATGRHRPGPWLRRINRENRPACRMVLVGHRSEVDRSIAPSHTIWGLALTGDGRLVSGGGDGTIRLWSLSSGRELYCWKAHEYVRAMAASGSRIVSGGDRSIRLWDCDSDVPIAAQEMGGTVRAIALSPDGEWALIGGDGCLCLWNLDTDGLIDLGRHLDRFTNVLSVTFLGSSRRFAFGRDSDVVVMDLGRKHWSLPAHHPRGLAYVASRDWLLFLDPHGRWWGAVHVAAATIAHSRVQGHSERLTAIAATSDGTRVITGSHDATIWIWDALSAEPLGMLSGHGWDVTALLPLADGRLISGSEDGTIRLWDLNALEPARPTAWAKRRHVSQVAFTPDGRVLAHREGDGLYEFDAHSGRLLRTAPEDKPKLMPGGHYVRIERDQGWDALAACSGQARGETLPLPGEHIASIHDRTLTVLDPRGKVATRYVSPNELCSFATDGNRLAIGDRAGTTVLLELMVP